MANQGIRTRRAGIRRVRRWPRHWVAEPPRPAVFLDRDGTLIRNCPAGCQPDQIEILPGVIAGLRLLQEAGYRLFIATNQSGIARGYFSEAQLAETNSRLLMLLSGHGVRIDGVYYCPHHPDGVVEPYARTCACRKPQPGLLLQAAQRHGIDLPGSWMIGDILDDVETGHAAGCRSILVDQGSEPPAQTPLRVPDHTAGNVWQAAHFILANAPQHRAQAQGMT